MNTTGKQIEFNNAEAERIMAAHGSPVSLVVSTNVEGDGVQPHSKGALYPGVITVVDHHNDHGEFEYRRYLASWKNEASASFRHREQAEDWIIRHKAKAEGVSTSNIEGNLAHERFAALHEEAERQIGDPHFTGHAMVAPAGTYTTGNAAVPLAA